MKTKFKIIIFSLFLVFLSVISSCTVNREISIRKILPKIVLYTLYWGANYPEQTIANEKKIPAIIVKIKTSTPGDYYKCYLPSLKAKVILVFIHNVFYIYAPFDTYYDPKHLDVDLKDKDVLSIMRIDSIKINNEKLNFNKSELNKSFTAAKKIGGYSKQFCLGPVLIDKMLSDAYIRVYSQQKNSILYWPIWAGLYEQDGKIDYGLIDKFNSNVLPCENDLEINDPKVAKIIESGLCY